MHDGHVPHRGCRRCGVARRIPRTWGRHRAGAVGGRGGRVVPALAVCARGAGAGRAAAYQLAGCEAAQSGAHRGQPRGRAALPRLLLRLPAARRLLVPGDAAQVRGAPRRVPLRTRARRQALRAWDGRLLLGRRRARDRQRRVQLLVHVPHRRVEARLRRAHARLQRRRVLVLLARRDHARQ